MLLHDLFIMLEKCDRGYNLQCLKHVTRHHVTYTPQCPMQQT